MFRKLNLVLLVGTFGAFVLGCGKDKVQEQEIDTREHKAVHGGSLNALGTCENGHVEVKVEGDVLKLWFVGGGSDTDKAVRIPDKDFVLTVTPQGSRETKMLVLKAKPIEIAEETVGKCSHFEGEADWLKDVREFVATGSVIFKGRSQAILVEYPAGYDPDDDNKAGKGNGNK
jgi:hypothetical protein